MNTGFRSRDVLLVVGVYLAAMGMIAASPWGVLSVFGMILALLWLHIESEGEQK